MALRARKILDIPSFTVLADKGYYHTRDLAYCNRKGITAYVPRKVYANSTGNQEFFPYKFSYDPKDNCYYCPAG